MGGLIIQKKNNIVEVSGKKIQQIQNLFLYLAQL